MSDSFIERPLEGPGFTLRERVEDYETLLANEGLGLVTPLDVEENLVIMGGMHTGFDGERVIDHTIDEVSTDQLLEGTGLTQRQYEVIVLFARDSRATGSSIANELEISTSMVHSHRRKAQERLVDVGASPTAVFDVEPSKGRKEPESIEETDELRCRIENNYQHLHEREDATTRRRILEGMLRSTTRDFVDRDPDISEVLVVQELLKGYWSFELFGSVARSVYRPGMTEQRYSGRIRDVVVNRSLSYLNQFKETGIRPNDTTAHSSQRDNPEQPSARHWYDTSDIEAAQGESGPEVHRSASVASPKQRVTARPARKPDDEVDTDSVGRFSRLIQWRPWKRRDG